MAELVTPAKKVLEWMKAKSWKYIYNEMGPDKNKWDLFYLTGKLIYNQLWIEKR